ncbi:MAG TPA: hypothetical protein VEC99_10040 [Clostridia bacterium]|nr:hypothetical protein [Clostridia bacterium]
MNHINQTIGELNAEIARLQNAIATLRGIQERAKLPRGVGYEIGVSSTAELGQPALTQIVPVRKAVPVQSSTQMAKPPKGKGAHQARGLGEKILKAAQGLDTFNREDIHRVLAEASITVRQVGDMLTWLRRSKKLELVEEGKTGKPAVYRMPKPTKDDAWLETALKHRDCCRARGDEEKAKHWQKEIDKYEALNS